MFLATVLTLGAYLIGSLSAAILVCKIMGLADPRTQGSRNPGATNVLRLGGKKAAAVTLAGDILKGLIALLVARWLSMEDHVLAAVGLAAFLGHLYPLFFGFHGGKGVATAFGVLLGVAWPAALAVLATWLLMARLFRISSLAALTAAAFAPLYVWIVTPSPPLFAMVGVMSLLLIWRHRTNIHRLLRGEEGKITGS